MYQYVSSQVSSSGGMFRRRGNDLLPVASGTRQTGLRASEVMTAPKISGGQKVSLVVFVISMLFVVTGYMPNPKPKPKPTALKLWPWASRR
mmetsp:Transcript_16026/g.48949  ORF Transcript_16026/g.48949 Transcript_16026/m.48949 type:complete len:91 (+) Transcript_16026:319-591(+)